MAYKSIDQSEFLDDLHSRKEFYELKFSPEFNFRNPGTFDPLEGKYLKLHSHQLFVRNFINPNTSYKRLLLKHNTGTGKCHRKGTEILMYDGSVKCVEDIVVGDVVMGADSAPQRVLSTTRGIEQMYRVVPDSGKPFDCNESHILSLKSIHDGTIIDVSIGDYIGDCSRCLAPYRLYRTGVEFPAVSVSIDPYMFGRSLGDRNGVAAACGSDSNGVAAACQCDRIPHEYKCNERQVRLQTLAGIIDACGRLHDDAFEVVVRQKGPADGTARLADGTARLADGTARLANDIAYLARSLGFAADVHGGRVVIRGRGLENIPTRLPGMRAEAREREDLLLTGFVVVPIPWSECHEYYGIGIDSPHRYLLADFTVVHNSMSAIAIAQTYIEIFKKQYLMATLQTGAIGDKRRVYMEADRMTPSVFVFGFEPTKNAFYRDLLRYPEFGFITQTEKEDLAKLQRLAATSGIPADKKRYQDELHKIRKRITNKSKDGFYKFYGYQKFVNMLFLSSETSLVELEKQAMTRLKNAKPGENVPSLEDLVAEHVASGKIQINHSLLEQFRGSFIICDEFHNTYNMNMKNNYGVAIQYILDYHYETINCIFLSATPINNSPTEIVEIINYLVPPSQKITKKDLFLNNRDLKPGMLERIGEMVMGRVSFLQDFNPKYFPKRTFVGETIALPTTIQGVNEIPYLKFIPCKMSALHQDTYIELMKSQGVAGESSTFEEPAEALEENAKALEEPAEALEENAEALEENAEALEENAEVLEDSVSADLMHNVDISVEIEDVEKTEKDEKRKRRAARAKTEQTVTVMQEELDDYDAKLTRVPTSGYAIYDGVFPNPENPNIGLYRSGETRNKLTTADPKWKQQAKVEVKKFSSANYLITGDFLRKENVGNYFSKYYKVLDELDKIAEMANPVRKSQKETETDAYLHGEKIMIYHDRVKMSGVLLIQELLRQNGYIDEFSEPVDNTRCAFCTGRMGDHPQHIKERNLIDHKYHPARFVMAHSDIDRATMEASITKYSSPDNTHGAQYKILVGSKIIREGYEMKAVQHLFVTMLPVNIPSLIQVLGRCIRKNSHIDLPPEKREVKIRLFITQLDRSRLGPLPSDAISPEELRYVEKLNDYIIIQQIERQLNKNAVDAAIHRDIIMPPELLHEYFPSLPVSEIKNTIYETDTKPVDTIGNLYFNVKKPPEYKLSDLNMLTFTAYGYYNEEINTITYLIKRLFIQQPVWTYDDLWKNVRRPPIGIEVNPQLFSENNFVIALDRLVSNEGSAIEESIDTATSRLFDPNDKYIYTGGNRYVIQQVSQYYIMFPIVNGVVVRDADSYIRVPSGETGVKIDIDSWITESKSEYNYFMRKQQFKAKYCGTQDIIKFLGDFDEMFYNKLLEEIIAQGVDGKPKIDEQLKVLYSKVIELFDRFRIIVYLDEVVRYRDTARKFTSGRVISVGREGDEASRRITALLPLDTPIGFLTQKSIRLYDSPNWIEVSKTSMNKRTHFVENDIIVGYFDQGPDGNMKFKLRKPVQQLRRETGKDARTVERGIVCSTKSKDELEEIAKKLGIDTRKMQHGDFKIKTLCEVIKNKLLEMEMKHRQRDDKYKVFYLWNEQQPNLTGPPGVPESQL